MSPASVTPPPTRTTSCFSLRPDWHRAVSTRAEHRVGARGPVWSLRRTQHDNRERRRGGDYANNPSTTTEPSKGCCLGVLWLFGLILRSLWGLYKMHETLWFLFGVVVVCSSSGRAHCRELTPVCHDCLVVNGTSKLIINISPRHGC